MPSFSTCLSLIQTLLALTSMVCFTSQRPSRCPGCGGRVEWHIPGPAWRPERYCTRLRWTCEPPMPAPDAATGPAGTNRPCRVSWPERTHLDDRCSGGLQRDAVRPDFATFVHCLDLGSSEMNQRHVTAPAASFWTIRVRGLWLSPIVPLDVPILTSCPSQRPQRPLTAGEHLGRRSLGNRLACVVACNGCQDERCPRAAFHRKSPKAESKTLPSSMRARMR